MTRTSSLTTLLVVVGCLALWAGDARAQSTTTYHLHRENSPVSSLSRHLKTVAPDAAALVLTTGNLKGFAASDIGLGSWDTAQGVPGLSGVIPTGSQVTVSLYMKKTSNWGTVFPYATMKVNDAFGAFFCQAVGSIALTTTLSPYTFSCTTTSPIAMIATDRLIVFAGAHMTVGPGSHNMEAQLQIEGTTDATFVMPNPIPAPSISSLNPTSGLVGQAVTVTGSNFGSMQSAGTVTFNGVAAAVTNWSTTSIGVTVPSATTGPVVVTVGGQTSNGVTFTVTRPPAITSITPSSTLIGAVVTIHGTDFGTTQGASTVTFNGTPAVIDSWSESTIDTSVPNGATSGPIVVTVNGQSSNAGNFTVGTTLNDVTITAYRTPSTSTYNFTLLNTSDRPIVGILIGDDLTTGQCGLSARPQGWNDETGIPAGTATTPIGWTAEAYAEEETNLHCLSFMADENDSAWDLAPGVQLSGFSVTTEVEDPSYLYAYVTVIFDDGSTVQSWVEETDPPM